MRYSDDKFLCKLKKLLLIDDGRVAVTHLLIERPNYLSAVFFSGVLSNDRRRQPQTVGQSEKHPLGLGYRFKIW